MVCWNGALCSVYGADSPAHNKPGRGRRTICAEQLLAKRSPVHRALWQGQGRKVSRNKCSLLCLCVCVSAHLALPAHSNRVFVFLMQCFSPPLLVPHHLKLCLFPLLLLLLRCVLCAVCCVLIGLPVSAFRWWRRRRRAVSSARRSRQRLCSGQRTSVS